MFRFRYFEQYSSRISVDLGTANTLVVCARTGDIILNEPSVVTIKSSRYSGESSVCAVGHEAKQMGCTKKP